MADKKAGKPPRKKKPKGGLMKLFKRLFPFGLSAKRLKNDPTATAGRFELFAIMIMSILRTWHVNRMVYVKRDLMLSTYNRNIDMFKQVMFETVPPT